MSPTLTGCGLKHCYVDLVPEHHDPQQTWGSFVKIAFVYFGTRYYSLT